MKFLSQLLLDPRQQPQPRRIEHPEAVQSPKRGNGGVRRRGFARHLSRPGHRWPKGAAFLAPAAGHAAHAGPGDARPE